MTIKQLVKTCHKIAKSKGFWSGECYYCLGIGVVSEAMVVNTKISTSGKIKRKVSHKYKPHKCGNCKGTGQVPIDRNDGEIIALIHEELSETLRAFRKGNPKSKKIPKFSEVEEELGDCIIRILDMVGARDRKSVV